jgi:hypothetical protein
LRERETGLGTTDEIHSFELDVKFLENVWNVGKPRILNFPGEAQIEVQLCGW